MNLTCWTKETVILVSGNGKDGDFDSGGYILEPWLNVAKVGKEGMQ